MVDMKARKRAVDIARSIVGKQGQDDPAYILRCSASIERAMWLRQERRRVRGRCHFCKGTTTAQGSTGPFSPTVDHIIPLARRGPDHPSNWRLACLTCNQLKGNMSEAEFIAELRKAGVR
jgi:5-methylcytosine-specific restriction endonuclease McrA